MKKIFSLIILFNLTAIFSILPAAPVTYAEAEAANGKITYINNVVFNAINQPKPEQNLYVIFGFIAVAVICSVILGKIIIKRRKS